MVCWFGPLLRRPKLMEHFSRYCGDIEGFVSKSRDMAVRGVQGKHEIIPAEIHFNSSHVKAVSESIGTLRVPVNLGDISHHLTAHMRFLSTLEKHGNDWRLLSFEAIYDSDCLTPGFPTQKTLSSEPSQDSRSSYRITTRVLEQLGLTINQDLLGTDRPEAIEDAMKRYFSWLHC